MAKEIDYRGVDLCRPLLLGPVTATRQHDRPAKLGDEFRQIGDRLVHAGKSHHDVAVAGDVERGYGHPRAGKRSEKLPVAVDVSVIVQTAAEPGAGEFSGVEVDVGFG
jgi:hypothetical protein